MKLRKYIDFVTEHKLYGKSIKEILKWLKEKSNEYWIFIDTETTGLPNNDYDVQLTQVSCIVTKYNYTSGTFDELDIFNKKIKLTDKTKSQMKDHENIKKILSFNHYGSNKEDFFNEEDILDEFSEFINKYSNSLFIIQNAKFDMKYLNTRGNVKFKNEIIDTKQILQYFYLPTILKLSENNIKYLNLVNTIGKSSRDNGLISSSLSKVGPALGIDMNGYHDAITDVRITINMLGKIIEFLKSNENVDIKKYQHERFKVS